MITYHVAAAEDTGIIAHLLEINHLPFSDIGESAVEFIIAKSNERIIGCIGLEKHEKEGLLRSFAVDIHFRNKGVGKELYYRLLNYASQSHIKTLHLLTTTARDYFTKTGFVVANRNNAPEIISQSKEFSELCPVSSVYMILEDIPLNAV